MPPFADKKTSNGANPEKPSVSVEDSWRLYNALGGTEYDQLRDESYQVVKIVSDFGKDLIESTMEAAQLAPMIQLLRSSDQKTRQAAWLALNQYTSRDPQNVEYVRALSVDIGIKIPEFIDEHYAQKTSNIIGQYDMIALQDVLELMSSTRTTPTSEPQGVNIESVLISASILYLKLEGDPDDIGSVPEELLYAAEAFYQPLLEIIGYDGLVMAIKQRVDLIRLARAKGKYDGITKQKLAIAQDALDQLPKPEDMPKVIDGLISRLTYKDAESKSVLTDTYGHGMQVGAGRVIESYIDELEDTMPTFDAVRYIWRVKTATSASRKVLINKKNGSSKPVSDLVGITVVVPSIDGLASYFQNAAGILQDLTPSQLALATSRNKDTAFHAKADEHNDIIEAIEVDLGNLGARLDKKISDNGHKVIKITLQYTPKGTTSPIPVEIQFQTTEDRTNSRIGSAAHANKSIDYKTDAQMQRVIKELGLLPKRREKTNIAGLTLKSIEDANKFYPRIVLNQETQRALGAVAAKINKPRS